MELGSIMAIRYWYGWCLEWNMAQWKGLEKCCCLELRMKPGIESEMSGGIIWIKLGLEVGWNVLESQVLVVKYYLG